MNTRIVLAAIGIIFAVGNAARSAESEAKPPEMRVRLNLPCPYRAAFAFAPDGKSLAMLAGEAIEIWDLATAERTATWRESPRDRGCHSLDALAFSADGKLLAAGGTRGVVAIWDVSEGKLRHSIRAHVVHEKERHRIERDGKVIKDIDVERSVPSAIRSVALSPDGALAAAVSTDNTISISDTATGQVLHRLLGEKDLQAAAFLDATTLVSVRVSSTKESRAVTLWNARQGVRIESLPDQHAVYVSAISLSRTNLILAGAAGPAPFLPLPTIRLWDLGHRQELPSITPREEDGFSTRVAISPDGRIVASVGGERRLVLWRVADGARVAVLDLPRGEFGPELVNVAFAPDGKSLAVLANEFTPAEGQSYHAHGRMLIVEIKP